MSDTEQESERGPRSPGYPSISLSEALQKAEKLRIYSPSRKPIPVDTALRQWGYKRKSGAGMQQIAALKKFLLLNDEGSLDTRAVRLSDLAWKILTDPRPDSSHDKLRGLREAARGPKIHAAILDRWPHGLPDDITIQIWLVQEKGFNEKSVKRFLRQLRATFEYAILGSDHDLNCDLPPETEREREEGPTGLPRDEDPKPLKQRRRTKSVGGEFEAGITLMGDGDLSITAPAHASPANRPLVEAWIKSFLDELFSPPENQPENMTDDQD